MQNTHRTIRLIISILVGAMATWTAADASARIVIGQGIAGIKLGQSGTQVRKILGKPSYVQPPGWGYGNPLGGWIGFDSKQRVNDIWTTSKYQRTNKGIGPGSSIGAVRRAYPKVQCYRHAGRWRLLCVLRSRHHRYTIYNELLFMGRLSEVDIFLAPAPSKQRPLPK